MRNYQIGNQDLDARLAALISDAVSDHDDHGHEDDLITEMMVSLLKMHRDDTDRGDLKIVNSALKELRYSFLVFSRYRDIPKVTVYGSARTAPEDPSREQVRESWRRATAVQVVTTGLG